MKQLIYLSTGEVIDTAYRRINDSVLEMIKSGRGLTPLDQIETRGCQPGITTEKTEYLNLRRRRR